jgi:hypothetical protein
MGFFILESIMTNFEANKIADDRLRVLGWSEDKLWEFSKLSFDEKFENIEAVIAKIKADQVDPQNVGRIEAMQWEINQFTIASSFWAPAETLN